MLWGCDWLPTWFFNQLKMALISTIYSIIFLPLLASLLCQIFTKKNISFALTAACLFILLFLAIKISPEIFTLEKIENDFDLNPLSMALEFKLDKVSLLFLIAIILLNLIILFYYHIDIKNFLDQKNSKIFYSVYLLRVFTAIGVITSNNLLNLFLFLEIYACSFFAIFSISKDTKISALSFRYFSFNSAASLLMLFSFLIIYLVFGSLNLDIIKQNLIADKDIRFFTILASLVAIGLVIKFFPFWLYFENLKNNDLLTNFFAIDSLFIKANLGIFFAIKFSYLFFNDRLVLTATIFGATCLIFYSIFCLKKTKHFKLIAIYLCLINLALILICLALHTAESSRAAFFYWLNFNLVNLFIFIFATFLKRKFNTSSFDKLFLVAPYKTMLLPLKLLIIFIAAFPFTFLFYGNWYLILENLQFDKIFLNIIIITALLTVILFMLILSLKISAKIFFPQNFTESNKLVMEPYKYWIYTVSFWSLIILIYSSVFYLDFLNKLALKFII